MSTPIIDCISVCKYFTGKNQITKAVDNVNLQINMNEFILIKGRSGAGKSTLLNLMCGLDKPTSGSVEIENEAIDKFSNQELSRLLSKKIGIIFQNFNLLPTYTVFENIEIAIDTVTDKRVHNKEIILPLLEQLGLTDKVDFLPTELSIGQQQKVAIARTLAKKPLIIFADEPTGSVDDETASVIIQHLLLLRKEHNLTLVMASHGSTLDKYADRVILMQNGKIN
ncbi:MAG TPA: ABC transporter ATP-binding protein [Bacteroidales bacterium]|nr:ABC transporter ATP-binding protein [Bacteroidales bacterium]